jgi:sugar phosphate isomerase/epimerase
MWKLGIRLEVLPGANVVEKFASAQRYGFDAVELPGRCFDDYLDDLLAHRDELALPVCSISLGFRGSLVSADATARQQCAQDTMRILNLAADLGAVGMVMPPILHMDKHPRLVPSGGRTLPQMHDELLLAQLPQIADVAEARGVALILEAVNPIETDYMHTVAKAASICARVNRPGIRMLVDLFHMQWEEDDWGDLIRRASPWLAHVHIAEDSRLEPGPGGLDLGAAFSVLREVGYEGHVVIECRSLSGDADEVLPRSVEYVRDAMIRD